MLELPLKRKNLLLPMWTQREELDTSSHMVSGEEERVGYFSLYIFNSRDSYMSLWDAEGLLWKSFMGVQML